MPVRLLRPVLAVLLAALVAASVGACLDDPPPSAGAPRSAPTESAGSPPVATAAPTDPTPVPVPETPEPTEEPEPMPTQLGVTDTPWGTILDEIPGDWPVFAGAEPVDSDEGPASGAWLAPDEVDPVAGWYRDTLEADGFAIDNLSSPLEDGTRILDIATDLPECRIQITFRPADGSTMITVLYGAGCASGAG